MSSAVEFEALNVTAPVKNTNATKCIANLAINGSSQTVDLTTLFGALGNGHYLTFQAELSKIYIAFGASAGTIDEAATGTGATVCFPLAVDTPYQLRIVGGREVATGIATSYFPVFLHYKGSTGFLRVYRSSVGRGEGIGEFPAP